MDRSTNDSLSAPEKLDYLARILEGGSYDAFREELSALARDHDDNVRKRALDVFWHLTDPDFLDLSPTQIELCPDFINPLIDLAKTDSCLSVRAEAVRALGRYVYEGFRLENLPEEDFERIRGFLWDLYHSPREPLEVRCGALEALGYITDEDIEATIREAHGNPQRLLHISSLFAMGRSGMDNAWDDLILKDLRSADDGIRFEAVRAAAGTYAVRGAELLEQLTEDPDRRIRLEAIRALGTAGRGRSREILLSLRSSPDEDIRDAASGALQELDYFQDDSFFDE